MLLQMRKLSLSFYHGSRNSVVSLLELDMEQRGWREKEKEKDT